MNDVSYVESIEARRKAQLLMAQLHAVGNRELPDLEDNVFNLLMGSSLSLWRVAFLMDTPRDTKKIRAEGLELLGKILADNALAFGEERNRRAWVLGYYVNNARFRIAHVHELLRRHASSHEVLTRPSAAFNAFQELHDGGLTVRPQLRATPKGPKRPKDMWRVVFEATEEVASRFLLLPPPV